LDLLEAVVEDRLEQLNGRLEWDPRPAVCVVLASGGYPGPFERGMVIEGLAEGEKMPGGKGVHAGTRWHNGRLLAGGGRVLNVTALGDTLADAKKRAYEAVARIRFARMHYRTDIADRALGQTGESQV